MIARWWRSGESVLPLQPSSSRRRTPVREAAVAAFIDFGRSADLWALARACERLLARHWGDAIRVRPERGRRAA